MWYLGLGSSTKLCKQEKKILAELSECLSIIGWELRSGGRGDVEDALLTGVPHMKRKEVHIPFPQYRQYDTHMPGVLSFSKFSESIILKAYGIAEPHYKGGKIVSPMQKNILGSSATLVLGATLTKPVKFAITMVECETSELNENTLSYDEFVTVNLLNNNNIPIFNLSHPPHYERIKRFIDESTKVAM